MYSVLEPVNIDFDFQEAKAFGYLGGQIAVHTSANQPELSQYDMVLLGVKQDGNAIDNEGASHAPDAIRKSLYNLFPGQWKLRIVDAGNIKISDDAEETYANLLDFLQNILPHQRLIVLGGTQDITHVLTKYFDLNNKAYNLSVMDCVIDGSILDSELDNENFLTSILTNDSSLLRNLSILGVQTYYNHPSKYKIFDQMFVDYYKLGDVQAHLLDVEPELRDAQIVSVDVGSIRYADMPAQVKAHPNGFTGKEICTLARYAGLSMLNKFFGIFEFNPFYDTKNVGEALIAQMIWYYLEGANTAQDDYPLLPKKELMKFYVQNDLLKLVFYHNKKTGRWWVSLPEFDDGEQLYSCSESDYEAATHMKVSKRIYQIINKSSL